MLQFLSDNSGHRTALVIPIEEWNGIKSKYPGIDAIEGDLPQWQKDLIDKDLKEIADNPQCLRPIEELLEELDKED